MTNLETIRRTRGLKQEELALSADVPQATVSRAENGKGITLKSAMRIARALGLSTEEVFGDAVIDDEPIQTLRDATDEPSSEIVHPVRPSHPVLA